MKTDSVSIELVNPEETVSVSHNIVWIYPAMGILCIGLIIWGFRKYRHSKYNQLKKVLKGDSKKLDFDNVINNAFHAQDLYDELKGVCHPDKFATNPELCEKATELFALLVKNKHNYQELLQIKKRIEEELNVKL